MKIISIFMILALPLSALAQDKDLFKASYRQTKIKNEDTAKKVNLIDASLLLPISNKDDHQLGASLGYRQLSMDRFEGNYPGTVYAANIRLAYQKRLSDENQLRLFGQLGAFSDFESSTSDILRWTIGFEHIYKKPNDDKIGLGAAYSRQFYGHQIIFLIELDQQISERWSISGIFPVNPRLEYKLNNKSNAGIELNIDVNTYRFSSVASDDQYLKNTQFNISLFYRHNVFGHWNIDLRAGISPKQEFDIYDEDAGSSWTLLTIPLGKKSEPVQRFSNSAFSGQIGIAYSIF